MRQRAISAAVLVPVLLLVLAIAGISLRRVMGFTVMSFFVGVVIFGLALLFLA